MTNINNTTKSRSDETLITVDFNLLSLPKISIIVPVYNTEPYLRRCLDSILNQTFKEFECILIDDCSPDNCPAICDEYAEKDLRFKVIHNQQNQGSSLSRQIGLNQAKGNFIQFADSDDRIESNMVEMMYNKAIEGNFDIVYCDSIEEKTSIVFTNRPTYDSTDKTTLIKQLFAAEIHPSLPHQLIKHDLFLKVLFPQESFAEDWLITTQTIHYASKISYVPIVFHHYCYNPNSLTRNNRLEFKKINDNYSNYFKIIDFLGEHYNDISIFNPELSNFINKVKLSIILNKKTRKNINRLFELYPPSNRLIFNKKSSFPLYHKIFLFLAVKNILFPLKLLDVYYALRHINSINTKKI